MTTVSESALGVSVASLPEGIQVIGFDWTYLYVNPTGARHGRKTPHELMGATMMASYPGIEHTPMFAAIARVMRDRQPEQLLTEFGFEAGAPGWFELRLEPVPDGVCVLSIDVTERQRLSAELRQSQKMEAVGRLAGGIAHDLNNVLTAILGYSELLLERVADQEVRSDVEEIQRAGQRAGALTRQLLAFSRSQVLVPQVLDINRVVLDLEKLLSRVIREDIRMEISVAEDLAHIKADPGQIEQVLMNLVVNARDAMPQGGPIRISTSNAVIDAEFVRRHDGARPGRYVALLVEDSGLGMSPDVVAHIFEPFYTTKGPGKGTGLGMATVYGIVKQSGGYIAVESRPTVGTRVTTYWPATGAAVETEGPRAELTDEGGSETILLAEDDAPIREWMRKTLARRGYRVLEARDVADAMSICRTFTEPIHLLVSDIVMPEMNGPNLAQHLLCDRPALRVLYVSGFPHSEQVGAKLKTDRVLFLAKPFAQTALLSAVRQLLVAA
jgi:two-component system cell cycle sensor histidine kinase/response regulator CckA